LKLFSRINDKAGWSLSDVCMHLIRITRRQHFTATLANGAGGVYIRTHEQVRLN